MWLNEEGFLRQGPPPAPRRQATHGRTEAGPTPSDACHLLCTYGCERSLCVFRLMAFARAVIVA